MRRAQAAVETLLIYGVAILVVMLAIGALIGFGVLNLDDYLPEKCEMKGVSIRCADYLIEDGRVSLQLQNSIGKNIAVVNISVIGEDDNEGLWGDNCQYKAFAIAATNPTPEPPANALVDKTLDPAARDAYTIINGEKAQFNLINCDVKVPAGKKIKGKIMIKYATVGSTLVKTAYGEIFAKVSG